MVKVVKPLWKAYSRDAFGLDYAFVPYGDLGPTSHSTLNYRWGAN